MGEVQSDNLKQSVGRDSLEEVKALRGAGAFRCRY